MTSAPLTHLDTHVALWLYDGETGLLSQTARAAIEAGSLEVSPMVELEIQYLVEIGRFRDDPSQVIGTLASEFGLGVSATPFSRVVAGARSLRWTRDAFDRLITAQAMHESALLVTRDRRIRDNFAGAVW